MEALLTIAILVDLRESTDIAKKKGYEAYAEVTEDMSWQEARKRCKGITFDDSGNITKMKLNGLGLTGKQTRTASFHNCQQKNTADNKCSSDTRQHSLSIIPHDW